MPCSKARAVRKGLLAALHCPVPLDQLLRIVLNCLPHVSQPSKNPMQTSQANAPVSLSSPHRSCQPTWREVTGRNRMSTQFANISSLADGTLEFGMLGKPERLGALQEDAAAARRSAGAPGVLLCCWNRTWRKAPTMPRWYRRTSASHRQEASRADSTGAGLPAASPEALQSRGCLQGDMACSTHAHSSFSCLSPHPVPDFANHGFR